MANTSSKRVSIRQHQVTFLESFAPLVGTDDLSEIINWVLVDYRQIKSASQSHSSQITPFPQPQHPRATSADDDLAEALLAAI